MFKRNVPCNIFQWASKSTRKLVESSLGVEAYAPSEMVRHVSLLREVYEAFVEMSPGVVGREDCESLFERLRTQKIIADAYLGRRLFRNPAVAGEKRIG